MSFQSYLNNRQAKSGKSPSDFRNLTEQRGFTANGKIKPGIKADDIVKWLKDDYDLGHGHSMAIYALLKGLKSEESKS